LEALLALSKLHRRGLAMKGIWEGLREKLIIFHFCFVSIVIDV
jgi:hypothetical protein